MASAPGGGRGMGDLCLPEAGRGVEDDQGICGGR